MPRAPVGSGCPVSSKNRGKCRSQTGCGSAPVLKQKKKQPKKNGGFKAAENGKNQPKVVKKSKKVPRIKEENAGTPDEGFESGDGNHGWSKEQEMKLRNAYLLVKVSPNFWKEIAKQVPGKTAKECFDKFYSDNPTPEAEKTRARRGDATSPIKTLSNLLSPSRLIVRTKSRFAGGKRGLINSHKTVREILRKRQTSDREYEEDAFEALQSQTISATSQSPGPSAETPASSTYSRQGSRIRSRLGSMSPLSGIVCSKDSVSESPEVLKHIKDPKQHDRYLDLLISRQQQSKRYKEDSSKNKRAACSSFSRMLKDVVAARAAVLGDAHDALKKASTAQSLEQDHCMEDEDEDDNDIESDKEDLDV